MTALIPLMQETKNSPERKEKSSKLSYFTFMKLLYARSTAMAIHTEGKKRDCREKEKERENLERMILNLYSLNQANGLIHCSTAQPRHSRSILNSFASSALPPTNHVILERKSRE